MKMGDYYKTHSRQKHCSEFIQIFCLALKNCKANSKFLVLEPNRLQGVVALSCTKLSVVCYYN